MVVIGTARPAAADFRRDLADPLNREWEDYVISWFRDFLKRIVYDRRDENGAWDFEILLGNVEDREHPDRWRFETMDVKADGRCLNDRDNLFFEDHETSDGGSERPGWGRKWGLELLAVVSKATGQMFVIDVPKFRTLVDGEVAAGRLHLQEIPNVDRANGRRWTTYGYPVPLLRCLRIPGLVRWSVQLPPLRGHEVA